MVHVYVYTVDKYVFIKEMKLVFDDKYIYYNTSTNFRRIFNNAVN